MKFSVKVHGVCLEHCNRMVAGMVLTKRARVSRSILLQDYSSPLKVLLWTDLAKWAQRLRTSLTNQYRLPARTHKLGKKTGPLAFDSTHW